MQTNEPQLISTISITEKAISGLGVPLLNELIHAKIRNGNPAEINIYKDCIPVNILWKTSEIPPFIATTSIFLET